MNLRQIEAFKAVIETGTVTKAAARLSISQPAVSKLLQLFERGAGMVLFARDRGRLSPTPEARLLYEEVERVFQGAERIRVAAEEIRSLQRGSLAIGAMPALSVGFIQEVLAKLRVKQPGVSVMLHARETPKLVEQLVTHQIELLCSVLPMEHPEIRTELLCHVPLVCILPLGHRLASRRVIRCRDLAGERFASFRHDSLIRRRIDQAFDDAKVARTIALEAPMAPSICAYVARGLGVSIVNPLYVGAFAPALLVRPFLPRVESGVFMAMPRGRRLSALGEAFADIARAVAKEMMARDGTITFRYG
ncbi:MAG: LysR family transcriptional regulator [Betaproteobacteria bacterium]|nr:LysR family transcriptional regulator [Betaproteobacteria bacterium]